MTGKSKDHPTLAALVANVGGQPIGPRISRSDAAKEIAETLKIGLSAAMATLYGLCATGDVRWFDDSGEIIDEDVVTIADFAGKATFVVADDVRHHLVEWSPAPQPKRRDQVIAKLLAEGHNPPRSIDWKQFCDLVRTNCNGWLKPGKPALSFGDRQIKRIVNELRA